MEKVVQLLNNSRKIYIYSAGNHINLANQFKNKMMEIGRSVEVISRFDLAFIVFIMQALKTATYLFHTPAKRRI